MSSVNNLIEQNNEKRTLLTKENEQYYSDLMVYIRLQFQLSEQQSEEVLMELLDHLIDGQNEGKSAREIFGDDPKGFADEIINQLSREDMRNTVPFYAQIIINILGISLVIRGVILGILIPFVEVNEHVFPVTILLIGFVILLFIAIVISVIFHTIKASLFQFENGKKGKWKDSMKVGLAAGTGMALVILAARFLPDLGPKFFFPWYMSLVVGAIFWGIARVVKKHFS